MFYWLMLFISIVAEIVGTSSIKYSGANAGVGAYLFLFIMVGSSYFFLSKAIQGMPLSLAYAVWEGVGLITVVVLGYLVFDEKLYRDKIMACMAILGGIVLMKVGHKAQPLNGGSK